MPDKIQSDIIARLRHASDLYKQGRYTQAILITEEVCDLSRRRLGAEDPLYASSLCTLAASHLAMGDYLAAEGLLLQAVGILQASSQASPLNLAITLHNLAGLYLRTGNYPAAERILRSLEGGLRTTAPKAPILLASTTLLTEARDSPRNRRTRV